MVVKAYERYSLQINNSDLFRITAEILRALEIISKQIEEINGISKQLEEMNYKLGRRE